MKGSTASEATRLRIELTTAEQDDRPIYITGNFNAWRVDQAEFCLQRREDGSYHLDFPEEVAVPDPIEYKYVKGSWANEEVDQFGNKLNNRQVFGPEGVIRDHVPRWRRNGRAYREDLLPEPFIISEHFEIPQLIKTRRITALLPHDYHETDRRYPVLYLQDGQNLFDDYAPFGSWGVDKKLAILNEKGLGDLIVVAIDHAEEKRIKEFTPSQQTRLGIGNGKKYVRFLADTLKPYIDEHFRTLPDAIHTGIGGSSMGGLISLYAGMMYPEVYSKWMIFSPSLWVAPDLPLDASDMYTDFNRRVYLYAGDQESTHLIERVEQLRNTLQDNHGPGVVADLTLSIRPGGIHNEHHWGMEFPKAVEWLFFQS
ncbi:MAG: alpha/beta hydrolase-fold protein [Bacteroidota bacterium]